MSGTDVVLELAALVGGSAARGGGLFAAPSARLQLASVRLEQNQASGAGGGACLSQLSAVNASIAANVGESLWKEVQAAVAQARAGK